MRKIYQKAIIMLSVACMGYATPAFAADAVVKTNKVWLSGATHIYGRMTVSGITSSNIKEKGFCYSSVNQMPTVEDGTSKIYLSNQGEIYNISKLEPATVYYIRAYVKQTSGDVVYGDPVKAITRPKGGVTYNINDGFPSDALTRVQSAAKEAIDLWNEYTGIHGLHITINYGAQTQTADCSYGGWMRIGPNASYQKTGTLLHEMLHAIGVGTHGTWQNSFLRSNTTSGYWLGVRATRALRFLDNSTTVRLNGDGTHMWPYGVNGAHEDNGTQILYVGNSLLAEALGEDGLAPTSSQFATPAYVFEQDDQQKYYLKNEGYGLGSKFLRVDKSGNLQWMAMSDEDATTNDSVAWNITFDPATCYYSLKNVATGKYLSYNSTGTNGIKTKDVTELTDRERFHFLPSSVEVDEVGGEMRTGYWIAHVQNNSAYCLTAQKTNATTSTSLKFSQEAGDQRWLILTADEAKELSQNYRNGVADELNAQIKELNKILHKYDKGGMLIGEGPLTADLIDITDTDFKTVSVVSIGIIFVIILILFKSISLPIILVCVIEFAIFINMGIPAYTGTVLPFIASIVIGTIQLGATVDYAILMTNKYKKNRFRGMDKKEAITDALSKSIQSIIVSALSFFAATFGVGLYSNIDMIGSLCMLMARGAIISMIVVIFILPSMFMVFDRVICASCLLYTSPSPRD